MKHSCLAALLLFPLLVAAGPAAKDRYYVFRFGGEPAGYVHARDSRGPAGERISWRETVLSLRRGDASVRIRMEVHSRSAADFTPESFSLLKEETGQVQRVSGHRDGAEMLVTVELGGKTSARRISLPAGAVFSSAAEQRIAEAGLEPGQGLSFPVFLEEANQVADSSFRLLRREPQEVLGAEQTVLVLTNEMLGIRGTETVREKDGALVAADLPALGTSYRLASRSEAMGIGPGPDLLERARYTTRVDLEPSETLTRLRLRLRGDELPDPPLDARQRRAGSAAAEEGLVLELTPGRAPRASALLPISGSVPARHLEPTAYEQSDDPRIRAAAARARGSARRAWPVARKLSRWVHLHISDKTMDRPYLSALETLQGRSGDCTEHAILFSALAKASGLPARIVNGLAYVDGAFAYHEWAEVYVGEAGWVAVDPTFDQAPIDAAHLALTVGSSDDEGMLQAGLAGLRYLHGLELEVLEAERADGTRIRP